MNKKLIERIRDIFHEKLKTKTGWGRNEIIAAYDAAVNQAIFEILEEGTNK